MHPPCPFSGHIHAPKSISAYEHGYNVISYDPNEEIHNRSKQVRRQSHIKQLTKLHGKVEIHEIQAAFEAQEWQTMRSLLLRLQKPYQNKPKKGPPPKSPERRDRGDVDQHAHLRAHRLPNLIPKSKRKKPGDSLASRRLRRQNPRGALQTLWIEILEILDQLGINRLSKIEKNPAALAGGRSGIGSFRSFNHQSGIPRRKKNRHRCYSFVLAQVAQLAQPDEEVQEKESEQFSMEDME